MTKHINVEIEYFDNDDLPPDQKYVAVIKEGDYKHTVVSGESIADCFHQMSISMDCVDHYKKSVDNPFKF
jgi:hypothetical protein